MERIVPFGDGWIYKNGVFGKKKLCLPHGKKLIVAAENGADGCFACRYVKKLKLPKAVDERVFFVFTKNSTVSCVRLGQTEFRTQRDGDVLRCDITAGLKYGMAWAELETVFRSLDAENSFYCNTGEVFVEWKRSV